MERNTLRFYWRSRAETTIEHWDLQLCALVDYVVVGMCSVAADDFAVHRHAETGSWVGRRYQRRGIGREIRHAALHLIFAGLDADHATTGAWHDNAASLAVTRALPYTQTATAVQPRRARPESAYRFTMTRTQWETVRRDDIELISIDGVCTQLATGRPSRRRSSRRRRGGPGTGSRGRCSRDGCSRGRGNDCLGRAP